ncbi:MAG: 4-hydroxy-tetrahydrodipicolinate synthase [Gloeomargaritaceae cyanobacterium C42_A2020_066]|nr:4-hydroxy-tetrahydrodipicolinate synthase [Gloeomargaritaceae cyanobacterium C42_A2020_066]
MFGTLITALVTPFNAEGQVDYGVAEQLALHLIDEGNDSLVVCGTTGESPTLTWDEEYELFQVIRQAAAGRAKVLAGTGSNSTREAITATEKAAKLGLDGSLQVVPYYNKPPQEGLYHHFHTLAAAVPDLPILLYNIPGRTGQNLLPETVFRLVENHANIVGIKEASGNLDQVSALRRDMPENFAIYSGDDSLTLPMLALGSVGVISVASHLATRSMKAMIQAYAEGKVQVATHIHLQLFPLFKVLFASTNPIPVKRGLQLQGWAVGAPRPPLCEASPELTQQLREVMMSLHLL